MIEGVLYPQSWQVGGQKLGARRGAAGWSCTNMLENFTRVQLSLKILEQLRCHIFCRPEILIPMSIILKLNFYSIFI